MNKRLKYEKPNFKRICNAKFIQKRTETFIVAAMLKKTTDIYL